MFCNRSPNLSVTFENTLNNVLIVDDVNDISDDNDNDNGDDYDDGDGVDYDYGDDNDTSF